MATSGVSHELIEDVEVRLEPNDDNELRISVFETMEGEQVVYSSIHSKDFYTSGQKRGTIANRIAKNVSDNLNGEKVADAFRSVCSVWDNENEKIQEQLRSPAVDQLLEETESVDVFGGEPTTITVNLKRNGTSRPLEFTAQEWTSNSAAKLRAQYYSGFYEVLEIGKDEWFDLRDSWNEERETVGREDMTERDAIASQVQEGLSKRLTVTDDREALQNDTYAAWYDVGNSAGDQDVTDRAGTDADVLWVRSGAVTDQLEEAGKNTQFLSEFSKTLTRDLGATYTTSKKKSGKRCYGFDPEWLGFTQDAIHSADEDPEVEP